MKRLILLLAITSFLFVSCATVSVRIDYDHEADFTAYKTFRIAQPTSQGGKITKKNMGLMDKRIERAIENRLQEMGYVLLKSGKPDFIVAHHVIIDNKVDIDRYGYRVGRWHRRVVTEVHRYKQGTLILDFVDADSKELFWRGTATGVLGKRDVAEKQIRESVSKILAKFPPK